MDIGLPIDELPGGANLLLAPEHCADVAGGEHVDAALREAIEVARAEMSRRRERLGKLTPEQELVIEDMLIRTVNRISKLVGRVLESLPSVA
jgi:hypothetical protein